MPAQIAPLSAGNSDRAWISQQRGAAWTVISLLTPAIPAILVADLILLALMGVAVPTLSTADLRASAQQVPRAFDFFWVIFALAFVVSGKLVVPSALALLIFHAFACLIDWKRWWAYCVIGIAIGAVAGSLWSANAMVSNVTFCAAFGAASGFYLWAVLYAPRWLRWTVVALVLGPAAIAAIGSMAPRMIAIVL